MRVLVADDSASMGRKISECLQQQGHEVVGCVQSGTQAIQMAKNHQPEAIVLDIVMPDMDGISALRAIRSLGIEIPAVMVTSAAGVGTLIEKSYRLGAVAVVSKPFSSDALQAAMGKCTTPVG